MDDEDFEDGEIRASRWHWTVLPLHGLTFAANVCSAAGQMLASVAGEVAGHYNYQSERDEFAAAAGRDFENLEQLLEGDD